MTVIVLVVTIFPILGVLYSVVGLIWNPKRWKRFLPFLIYAFFIGAYAFNPPDTGFDLITYLPLVEEYGKLSLAEALKLKGDILYASHIFFWICGHLGLPHLAPAITTSAIFGTAFYISCDTAERYRKWELIFPIILFQVAMLPYIMIINNVRNVFGLSMVVLAVYRDIIKNKRNWITYFLYIIGGLFHLSAFIFVVFRLISKFAKKVFGIIVLVPFFFTTIIHFLYNNIYNLPISGSIGNTIKGIIWRLYGYLTYRDLDYAQVSLNSKTVMFDRIVMMLGMIMSIIVVYYFLHRGKKHILEDSKVYCFIGLAAVMTISSNVFAMPNFWRFAAAFYVMAGVIAVPVLASYKRMPLIIKFEPLFFSIISVFSLFMQYFRYDKSDLLEWISVGFTTNIFTIIHDLIKYI